MRDPIIEVVNLLFAFGGCFCFGFIVGILQSSKKKKPKTKYPKCDCSDVNQCSKWCNAKVMFAKDFNDGKI